MDSSRPAPKPHMMSTSASATDDTRPLLPFHTFVALKSSSLKDTVVYRATRTDSLVQNFQFKQDGSSMLGASFINYSVHTLEQIAGCRAKPSWQVFVQITLPDFVRGLIWIVPTPIHMLGLMLLAAMKVFPQPRAYVKDIENCGDVAWAVWLQELKDFEEKRIHIDENEIEVSSLAPIPEKNPEINNGGRNLSAGSTALPATATSSSQTIAASFETHTFAPSSENSDNMENAESPETMLTFQIEPTKKSKKGMEPKKKNKAKIAKESGQSTMDERLAQETQDQQQTEDAQTIEIPDVTINSTSGSRQPSPDPRSITAQTRPISPEAPSGKIAPDETKLTIPGNSSRSAQSHTFPHKDSQDNVTKDTANSRHRSKASTGANLSSTPVTTNPAQKMLEESRSRQHNREEQSTASISVIQGKKKKSKRGRKNKNKKKNKQNSKPATVPEPHSEETTSASSNLTPSVPELAVQLLRPHSTTTVPTGGDQNSKTEEERKCIAKTPFGQATEYASNNPTGDPTANQRAQSRNPVHVPSIPDLPAGVTEFRFDSLHPRLRCAKPDCRMMTSCWDHAVVICPACGTDSFVRYCSKNHLYEDIQRHWVMDCGGLKIRLPIDRDTIRPHQALKRPYALGAFPNMLERHRQAVYRSMEDDDYFIFADLENIDPSTNEPTPKQWTAVRGKGKLVLRVVFSNEEVGNSVTEKAFFNQHMQCILEGGKPAAEESCEIAVAMIRNALIATGRWSESALTYLHMQLVGEWAFKVPDVFDNVGEVNAMFTMTGSLPRW